ncbi:MAG: hypothetical protein IJF78_05950 [Clostridia bacterium]|nr:hypothetical protein [Clostridia bacterium]
MLSKNVRDKLQWITMILSAVMVLMSGVLYMLRPLGYNNDAVYVYIRRTLIQLTDMIPFAMLVLFSVLRRQKKYRRCRWMVVSLLAARIAVDVLALICEYSDYVNNLAFTCLFDEYFITAIVLTVIFFLIAMMGSRGAYVFSAQVFLYLYAFGMIIMLFDDRYNALRAFWGIGYLLWFISVMLMNSALNEKNKYFPAVSGLFGKFLKLIGWTEEEADDRYSIANVIERESDLYVLIRAPGGDAVILRKDPRAEDWHNEYSVVVDDELIDSLLEEHIRMCREARADDDDEDDDEDGTPAERTESAASPDEKE